MRCLLGFICAVALVALPFSVSAQDAEEGKEPAVEELSPAAEAAPDEPALQLELDSAGVEVVPSAPRTDDGYTLEEMELRVKRAKIGLWSTAGATVIGGVIIGVSWTCENSDNFGGICGDILIPGVAGAFAGAGGMMVSGAMLGKRKRKLRSLQEGHYETPRRVQWDLETSRFVF